MVNDYRVSGTYCSVNGNVQEGVLAYLPDRTLCSDGNILCLQPLAIVVVGHTMWGVQLRKCILNGM